ASVIASSSNPMPEPKRHQRPRGDFRSRLSSAGPGPTPTVKKGRRPKPFTKAGLPARLWPRGKLGHSRYRLARRRQSSADIRRRRQLLALVLIGEKDDWSSPGLCTAIKDKANLEVVVLAGATNSFALPEVGDRFGHH